MNIDLTSSRLKTLVIILVILVVIVSGWSLYRGFQRHGQNDATQDACERAAIFHLDNPGSLVELTTDDVMCQARNQ